MPDCNECGASMDWGTEYQLEEGTDEDCLCPNCYHTVEGPY